MWRAKVISRLERTHIPEHANSKSQGVAMTSDSGRGDSIGIRRRDRDARSARSYTCILSQKPRPAQRGRNCEKSLTETAAVVTHCVFLLPPVGSSRRHKENESIVVVVVVVDDSHIQRIVLATEETTVTQQVSHRPIKCQSRLWSQRGTKVNGSHHGDNPLFRPTGIQIATKRYAALQAMAPTNIKTVHQTSLLHIESNLDRLGMLSRTHDQRSQPKNGKITLQPVLITSPRFSRPHIVQK